MTATATTTRKTAAKKTTARKTATKSKTLPSPLGAIPADSNRRADIEQQLLSLGITDFVYEPGRPISDFNVEASQSNQARIKPIDQAVVDRYTEAWKAGDQLPPVVSYRRARKLIVADGNHRLQSRIDAKFTDLDTYIITAPAKTIAVLTMVANAKHGLPTNTDERVMHAIHLMDDGLSQDKAAEAVGVPKKTIQARWRKVAADRRASDVGILPTEWDKLSTGVKDRLQFINTDEGFEGAVKLCIKAGVDTNEVHELVTALNESRSGRRQVELLKEYERSWQERIEANAAGKLGRGKTKTMTPKGRFNMALSHIRSMPENMTTLAGTIPVAEREDFANRALESAEKLMKFADLLKP